MRSPVLFARNAGPEAPPPKALLPGSFNPLHHGHWSMAAAASELLGTEVAFELSRTNVDKPELTDEEVARRAAAFAGRADLWVTRAPRFLDKADLFPGATFVLGADTAVRLVDIRYYDGDAERLAAALDHLAGRECRFLVAPRLGPAGLVALDDLAIDPRWRGMFAEIPSFRVDVSSTQLRG